MELLKLSKFKFQLQAIINEARHLKERERSAAEQIHLLVQKQKQTEEEYSRKLQELEAELASSNELCQKLERKVSYFQNDNALLENKQKELKETIHRLLQARENFINAYEPYLQKNLSAKDIVLQNVISEKEALHLEVGSLGIVLRRIQDAVASMNQQDKKAFHSALELKEEGDVNTTIENNRIEDTVQNGGESPTKASPPCQENKSVGSELLDNDNFTSCVSEASGLSTNWSQI
ncbi:hypothetical protein LWI28_002142 [Acer negundo]|uniref:Uncharacterized protein n=1 Tax=Acer negundo TaxID=4023 RepID=A0AAD5IL23_ACENE|nr:hypothetical protein LWI28_002142 [Acer negundo]